MKYTLIIILALLILPVSVSAATSVTDQQHSLDITVQSGRNQSFYLIFTSVEPSTITASGDISSWIRFGDNSTQNHTFTSLGSLTVLKVTILSPHGTAEGEYNGYVNADGTIISTLKVTVVPTLANITSLRNLADVNTKIDQLSSKLSTLSNKVDTNKNAVIDEVQTVKSKVSSITTNQNRVTVLEQEKNQLEGQVQTLNKELESLQEEATKTTELKSNLDRITGQVGAERSFSFGAGFLVGAVLIYLVFRRKLVKKAIGGKLKWNTTVNQAAQTSKPRSFSVESRSMKEKLLLTIPFAIPAIILLFFLL